MMWRTWNLGRVRGVAVMVDASALILVLYLGLRSLDQFRTYFDGGQLGLLVLVIVIGYLASIVLHEVGHVVAGRMFGIHSRAIVLHGFGGMAFLDETPDTPMKQAVISAAGPATNLVLWKLLESLVPSQLALGATSTTIWLGVSIVASANQWFGIFNLVPAPPLDGGSIMEALVWRSTGDRTEAFRTSGTIGLGALGVVAVLTAMRVEPFQWGILLFLGFICVPVCLARRSGEFGPSPMVSSGSAPRSRPPKQRPAGEAELEQLRVRAISQAREFGDAEAHSVHVLLSLAHARYSPVGLMLASFGVTYSDLWDLARQHAPMVLNMKPPQESRN